MSETNAEVARATGRAYWLWPVALPKRTRRQVYQLAGLAIPACKAWRWPLSAILIGVFPFLFSYLVSLPGHQVASAILVALFCCSCAREDAWVRGVALVALAFVAHCVAVIAIARWDPDGAARLLPGADDYWAKQLRWLQTGQDPEYEVINWLPAHVQLLGATILFSYLSLGATIFFEGFFQVDLMNFYNAQLIGHSLREPTAVSLGWHPWSLLRGVGYLFITFEVISLSLQQLTGVRLSTWRRRLCRWVLGLSFFASDCVLKLLTLGAVRDVLFSNLR